MSDDEEDVLRGVFLFKDGSRYEGHYVKTEAGLVRQGVGKLKDGPESYEGEFDGDKIQGKGVYMFASGARYEGHFRANKFDGPGEYRWPGGAVYVGTWKDGRMHGEGSYTDREGVKWSGQFHNGRYNNGKSFIELR